MDVFADNQLRPADWLCLVPLPEEHMRWSSCMLHAAITYQASEGRQPSQPVEDVAHQLLHIIIITCCSSSALTAAPSAHLSTLVMPASSRLVL
jgi:hypothetical protein